MQKRMRKLLRDPFGVLTRRISLSFQEHKYRRHDDYGANEYWTDRHLKYGFDLRGVGRGDLSDEENERMYFAAKEVFVSLCHQEKIDFQNSHMLDVGCGNGFYAKTFLENGGKAYLGIDITDVLFQKLRQSFPEFQFQTLDICTQKLSGQFDLITIIDVTQHIVNDHKFSSAMQNIKSHLSIDGTLIVTSWLSGGKNRRSFYEVSRPISAYTREFPAYRFSTPIPFRDKFIFSIRCK